MSVSEATVKGNLWFLKCGVVWFFGFAFYDFFFHFSDLIQRSRIQIHLDSKNFRRTWVFILIFLPGLVAWKKNWPRAFAHFPAQIHMQQNICMSATLPLTLFLYVDFHFGVIY